MGVHLSQELYEISYQTNTKIFSPMAIECAEDIYHSSEIAFSLLFCASIGALCDLMNVLNYFQSFWNHEICLQLNLPIFLVLLRQQEKSQKYFDLLAFK